MSFQCFSGWDGALGITFVGQIECVHLDLVEESVAHALHSLEFIESVACYARHWSEKHASRNQETPASASVSSNLEN